MKTPKTPATLEKKKLNTPKSGGIAKRKSVNGLTPKSLKKGGIPEFKGSAQALKSLASDEQNVTPFKNKKGSPTGKGKGAVSPEVELGLKIEAMLEKGVNKSPNNSPSTKKTPRKSVGQTPAKSTPKGVVNGALVTPKNKGTPKVHKETPYPKSLVKPEKVQTTTPEAVKEEEATSPMKKKQYKPMRPLKLEPAVKQELPKTKESPQKNVPKKGKLENQKKPVPKAEESGGEQQVDSPKKRKQKQKPSNDNKKSKLNEEKPQPGTEAATDPPKKKRIRHKKSKVTVKPEIPKDLLKSDKLLEVVRAYRKLDKEAKEKDKSLLRGEGDPISVLINAFKPPIVPKRLIRITLPNKLVSNNSDVAIFVSDVKKADVDGTIEHFEQYFKDNNVNSINAIIPIKKLVKEYGQFEQKRKLADQYDFFLVEGKISHRITQHLGKHFFVKRKFPVPVTLEQKKVKAKIESGLRKCSVHLAPHKKAFSTRIGHDELTDEQLAANINELAQGLAKDFPGGWQNVKTLFLKGPAVDVSLPIYYSAALPNSVPVPVVESKKKKQVPVVDELSTVPGSRVVVYPTGQVRLRKRKGGSDDENEDGEELKEQKKARKLAKKEEEEVEEDEESEDEDEEEEEEGSEDGEEEDEVGVKEEDDSEDGDSDEEESEDEGDKQRMERFKKELGEEDEDDDDLDDDSVGSAEDDLSEDEDDSEDESGDDDDDANDNEDTKLVKQLTKGRLLKNLKLPDEGSGDEDSDDSDEEIDEDEKMYMNNLNKILEAKNNKSKQQNKTAPVKKQPPVKPNNKKVTLDFQNKKNNANKQQQFQAKKPQQQQSQANKAKQAVKGGKKPIQNQKGGSPFRNRVK